jgi:hypothetical protein
MKARDGPPGDERASGAFLSTADLPGWWSVVATAALPTVTVTLAGRWSRQRGWGPAHRLALAAGALLTYAWVGIGMRPESGPKRTHGHAASSRFAA